MKNSHIKYSQNIIKDYQNGLGRRKISQKYHISDKIILKILEENNIHIRTVQEANSKRKYNIDDTYFDSQNRDMAYIMGFWAADGNVSSKDNRLDLELSSQDLEILKKFKQELKCERPIKIYECRNGYTKNKLYFYSSHIKKIFYEYGIVPNKTYSKNFHAPYKLKKQYWIDYIRGFFDGDGSICKSSSITFSINSVNLKFLQDIQQFFKEEYDISLEISTTGMKDRNLPMYRLYCYGNKVKQIFNILYTPDCLYLKRKYDKWVDFYNDIKSHETLTTTDVVE